MKYGLILFIALTGSGLAVFSQESVFNQETLRPAPPEADADAPDRPARIPTDKSIARFLQRVEEDPKDYQSLTVLGRLYLQDAKENDNLPAYGLAEEAFRNAVAIKPDHLPAKTYLATALQARHQFAAALALAEEVANANPSDTLALATIGDSQIELGQYATAEATYTQLAARGKSPAVAARLAHLAELKGDTLAAIKLMEAALAEVNDAGSSASSIAWYELRVATLLEREGRLDDARKHYESALRLVPSYAPAMSGLANLDALQGHLDEAAKRYAQAIEEHGEPPMMAALGDVYTKLGKHDRAKRLYDQADETMTEEANHAAAAHYREVAMFLADHDRDLPRALELAREDMKLRQDIYAYDTLAWTLFKNGMHAEALTASTKALRLGTRDARLHFHAGMIFAANGEHEQARTSLRHALDINPTFSLLHAAIAEQALRQLEDKLSR